MALVKMKRLEAILPASSRREVLRELYRLGCVEIESGSTQALDEYRDVLRTREENTGASDARARLTQAAAALDRYFPVKTPLLTPRRPLTEQQLFDRPRLDRALEAASEIVAHTAKIDEDTAAQHRLSTRIAGLRPWEPLDVPLEYGGSAMTAFLHGLLPSSADIETVSAALSSEVEAAELTLISSDTEQHYLTLLVYRPDEEAALTLLKSHGYMTAGFKGMTGTALENTVAMAEEITVLDGDIAREIEHIGALAVERESIRAAVDAYAQESGQDALLSAVGRTEKTVLLTGWVPAEAAPTVADALTALGCAHALSDPGEGDRPPTSVKNARLVDAFVGVTDMYGTPTYGSVIDPNPLMSIFYFTFFGFMLGDAMYGILIFVGTLLYLKLKRPAGTMKRMLTMFMLCGVSTFIAGVLTGSWFADAVSVVSTWLGAPVSLPPLWFDPLAAPMSMLVVSLVMGAIQIFTGMALSAYRMIKQGHALDALLDIGTWFVIFIGLGLFAAGVPVGSYLAVGGAVVLLLTGGRHNKGLGKVTGGFGSLYGITGYVSDLLSYSRIMALGLSGAVVGQVVNKIATMGSGPLGVVLFVSVFLFGHIFNLAIGLLGAYVHASRLQYIEFFGRFFEDGGRPFRPLQNNTKFVEIIKED